jgi:hypothetical protein
LNAIFPNDPAHPIYRLIKMVVCITALTVILAFQANNFDETELRTIFWFFASLIGVEGAGELFRYLKR